MVVAAFVTIATVDVIGLILAVAVLREAAWTDRLVEVVGTHPYLAVTIHMALVVGMGAVTVAVVVLNRG